MKTLILSHFKPYPPNHGAAKRIWNLALEKIKKGEEVIILHNCLNGPNKRSKKIIDGITIKQVPFLFKLMRKKHFLFQNHINLIIELLKNKDVDQIQLEFPYLLPTAILGKKILNAKLIYDAHGVEYEWQKELYNRSFPILIFIKIIEKLALKFSDQVLCCSERDKEELKRIYKTSTQKIKVEDNKINIKELKESGSYEFKKKSVLFVGSQLHPANKEAIEKIFFEILPKVKKKIKDFQFVFIGKNPPTWLKGPNILVIPEVYNGNIFPYIKGADICIAPIFKGSGTRIKILEYMACKKPIITTKKGIEGIKERENVYIEDTLKDFSKRIIELLKKT